jgi:hypothetical protein
MRRPKRRVGCLVLVMDEQHGFTDRHVVERDAIGIARRIFNEAPLGAVLLQHAVWLTDQRVEKLRRQSLDAK